MKKSKAISLLLSLSLLATAIVPGGMTMQAYAAPENQAAEENKGMEISKTAEKNADGSYTITLEAYATGKKVITESKKDVPTDIVLVLDQSGSMAEKMNTYAFRSYTGKSNSDYYKLRHNGSRRPNLYHQLADGSYASVSVTTTRGESSYTYVQCGSDWKNDALGSRDDDYKKYERNLYVKGSDGSYQKVILKTEDDPNSWFDDFIYVFPDDTELNGGKWSDSPNFGDKGPLYYLTEVLGEETYTYTYTDQDGVTQNIGTSTGETTQPEFTLYERYESGSKTRLEALQTAVSGFADSVKTKAAGQDGQIGTADDVNHRVAVVGFATGSDGNKNSPAYENTEVFVGRSQYKYKEDAKTHYQEALQDMSTTEGYDNVVASKNALAASGATYPNFGLEMAKGILDANPVPEETKRNRVVILFTDGTPGWSGYEQEVANEAVTQASTLKNAGVTVYSVGIFEGADATSAGIAEGASNRNANQFMQDVSSNNGTPQNPSYYLSAADADTLNNIFQQISDNIEQGGSSTTLDGNAVIKDIIAPQFELSAGATVDDIKLETYRYTGENQWVKNDNNSMGAVATVNGDQVDVSGFNFSDNWCGTETANGATTYRGNKLVISFPVKVKDGFLGGNGVYTNTNAGVYENKDKETPVFTFERPRVDVPIKDITVTAANKNVYLLGDLTGEQIKDGATVNVGNVELKLGENNFGLQSWQNEYVNIEVTYQDKDGNTVAELKNLKEDTTYTVSVKVSPKNQGSVDEKTGNAIGKINVFKPELTYKDSSVYYGDTAPTGYNGNLVSTKWFHNKTNAETVAMTGSKPVLDVTYTPDSGVIDTAGKINTKNDIPVKAEVLISDTDVNQYVTFKHEACTGNCGWNETTLDGDLAFLLHVDTCQLMITKTGGAAGEPYVFDVYKDGVKYSEVTIVGNNSETIYELPVGNYTIQEDAGWSWRYNGTEGAAVDLSKDNTSGSINYVNSKTENYWLNGFSEVVKNIVVVSHTN